MMSETQPPKSLKEGLYFDFENSDLLLSTFFPALFSIFLLTKAEEFFQVYLSLPYQYLLSAQQINTII